GRARQSGVPWSTSCHSSYRRISHRIMGGSDVEVNRRSKKAESLSASGELVAFFLLIRPCGEKSGGGIKARLAPILPFMALITPGPDRPGEGEPCPSATRPIGNHLRMLECKFRIVNHSFTAAWKCWTGNEIEKCKQCLPLVPRLVKRSVSSRHPAER